jgi:hypothetical protein
MAKDSQPFSKKELEALVRKGKARRALEDKLEELRRKREEDL